ncbi:predicted protein [Postia placenta Mad-698-R]|uniref:Uncharacterized protein n=1 Tax=Postia placenta MAD-698-R-SB12 TaxID=670580 RepID=A0A1X6MWX2_9APHY|nr:hypothetical protein POSPLADRAFT_1146921 [Postia placenta MAD-698-R-SB12]EED85055.1 predicted protein [Postia placenta Mad-698-R]OSX60864.1 hypothetical protein POSPLADRAFT_1146921 [Postia placenta MAD-698-R-SB12]
MSSALPLCRRALLRRLMSTSPRRATDSWLLPNIPEHLAKTTTPADAPPPPAPLPRPGESVETMRAMYQSRRRGTLESDLLLSTFAKEQLYTMNEAELTELDILAGFCGAPYNYVLSHSGLSRNCNERVNIGETYNL